MASFKPQRITTRYYPIHHTNPKLYRHTGSITRQILAKAHKKASAICHFEPNKACIRDKTTKGTRRRLERLKCSSESPHDKGMIGALTIQPNSSDASRDLVSNKQ